MCVMFIFSFNSSSLDMIGSYSMGFLLIICVFNVINLYELRQLALMDCNHEVGKL